MISPERVEALQSQFVEQLMPFGTKLAQLYPLFDRLVEAYSAPERAYHNLEHLQEMFRVVSRLSPSPEMILSIRLAVWYHDVVYDPRAKDNEMRSMEYMMRELSIAQVPDTHLDRVRTLILTTQYHNNPSNDIDIQILLDADLAILGASPERYQRYKRCIRQEYAHVEDADYRQGRARVLQQFLDRPFIYHTPLMREIGEDAARLNLQGELDELRRV